MSDAAAPLANPTPPLPFGPALGRYQAQAKAILSQPAVRRSLPMVLGTLAIAALAMLYILTRTPELRTLFANLPEADKAAVVGALQTANFNPAIEDRKSVV